MDPAAQQLADAVKDALSEEESKPPCTAVLVAKGAWLAEISAYIQAKHPERDFAFGPGEIAYLVLHRIRQDPTDIYREPAGLIEDACQFLVQTNGLQLIVQEAADQWTAEANERARAKREAEALAALALTEAPADA